jgi:nucleoside-triphosphatase
MSRKNVLVTGRPGAGKTTLIEAVLAGLRVRAGGFVTREIREQGRRVGFSIEDLRGERGVLAHVGLASPYRVGRYGVNRADLERVGVTALDRAVRESDLIVMDEIGRMELCSRPFQEAVIRALDSEKPVLGTIQDRSNAFLDSIRGRADVDIVRVTESNRDKLAPRIIGDLERLLERG